MDKRIFLFLIVLVAFTVEAKKKILKKKLNQLKGKRKEENSSHLNWSDESKIWLSSVQVMYGFAGRQILTITERFKIMESFENVAVMKGIPWKLSLLKEVRLV